MSQQHLVTTAWLAEHLQDNNLRVVDIRGYVQTRIVEPGVEEATYRGAKQEYLAGHIPGAVFIDWTSDIVDPDDPVPAQVAPPRRFAEAMGVRGIGDDTMVVTVDHTGGQFATRLWWALMYYGHEKVAVLDGGLKRWTSEGRPTESGEVAVERRAFHSKPQPSWRVTADDVRSELGSKAVQLIDARDAAQYTGEKRRGPRGGHIPGAINLPRELFMAEGGGFLPIEQVRDRVVERGLQLEKPVVAYCNGGVAATVVLFNLHRLGFPRLTNYDGSWNEWGRRADLPAETGAN